MKRALDILLRVCFTSVFGILLILALSGWYSVTPGAYIGTSTQTPPTSAKGAKAGNTFIESDTGKQYVYTGTAWVLIQSRKIQTSPDTLTIAGAYFPAYPAQGFTNATIVYTDSIVVTSSTIQIEGKLAGLSPLGWFNLTTGDSVVCTGANGTWDITIDLPLGLDSLRVKQHSEAGGVTGKFWSAILFWNKP